MTESDLSGRPSIIPNSVFPAAMNRRRAEKSTRSAPWIAGPRYRQSDATEIEPLQTFDELLFGIGNDGSRAHTLKDVCHDTLERIVKLREIQLTVPLAA